MLKYHFTLQYLVQIGNFLHNFPQ
jgi:translation initiation factor 3 subunit D